MLRSARFMDFVRQRSCCACSLPGPSDPHHAATGGRGIKADDYTCIPLCRICHNLWHSHRQFRGIMQGGEQRFILRIQTRLLRAYTHQLEKKDHGDEKEIIQEWQRIQAQKAQGTPEAVQER